MMETLRQIAGWLGAERYSEHAICLTNDPLIMTIYVAGDMVTFLSYFVIGIALISKRRDAGIVFTPELRLLGGAFIFLCGLSHFTSTMVLFSGVYRLDVMVTAAMAGVSAATAILVVKEFYQKRVI